MTAWTHPPSATRRWLLTALVLGVLLGGLLYMKFAMAATYTVNITADSSGTCGVSCSLREAITAANSAGVGPHTININIPGCSSGCAITLGSNLPDISRSVVINGTAQTGFSGVPLIRVNGNNEECLNFKNGASGSTVRGLVLSNCKIAAIKIDADNVTVAGNYIGTDLTGNAAAGNERGVYIAGGDGNMIGGTTAADRNVIVASTDEGIEINTDNTVVVGNYIGVGANGSAALGNGLSGVFVRGGKDNNRIGGVNAADANIIANNGYNGITLDSGGSSGNAFLRNALYNNFSLSIDLRDDGVTANDDDDDDNDANQRQNYPVLTSAVTTGAKITIGGTLNSNASTAFRIEFYSTPTADGSGHGEGQVYLGSTNVTTNGSGDAAFSQVLNGVAVTAGHKISATATVDLGSGSYGSTSEFSTNYTATLAPATATVSAISGNTSEAGGSATFTVVLDRIPSANVTIAVSSNNTLEGTVSTATLTFTTANWNTAQTVTVTGQDETLVDGNRAYTIVLGAATSADGAYNGLNPTDVAVTNTDNDTQSTIVVTTTSDVADGTTTSLYALLSAKGADGHISLREAITAANASANGGGGADRIHFAIALGAAGFTGTNGVDGRWLITMASAWPQITASVIIDGSTQTSAIANSNPGTLGTGGTVGTDALSLSTVNRPEIEIVGAAAIATAFDIAANDVTIRGFAIRGVGQASNDAAILVGNNFTGTLIEQNVLGSGATAHTDPGAGLRNYRNIFLNGADAGTVQNNLAGFSQTISVDVNNTASTWLISNNEVRDAALQASSGDAISISGGTANTVQGNLITGAASQAIIATGGTSNVTLVNNTVTGSGVGLVGGAPTQSNVVVVRSGVSGVTLDRNVISGNYGAGVAVNSGATNVRMTRNSIFDNGNILSRNGTAATGQIGIDLNAAADNNDFGTAPFYSANDGGDADTGGNNLQNFPLLALARTDASSQLILSGSLNSSAGSYYRIEFFASSSQHASGHGVAQRYLGFVNVATDGSGNASISTTLAVNVAVGEFITATATLSNAGYSSFTDTSEISRAVAAISSTQATITVDTVSNTSDGDTTSLSTLLANKGADGFVSLREAITAANNTANGSGGPDRIHFGISGTGVHSITPATALPAITGAVLIDATTDDSFAANSNRPAIIIDGNNLSADGLALTGTAGGSTIRGLVIRDFTGRGIHIASGADGNTITGNYIGALDTTGAFVAGEQNSDAGIRVHSANNTIGGTSAALRNVISGNTYSAISIVDATASGNVVIGNYMGVAADGSTAITGSASIVTSWNGANSNRIGGTGAGEGNIIANAGTGVYLDVNTINVLSTAILGNSIYGNTALGIDLNGGVQTAGVTANDSGDADSGPNNLQNFPVLTSAVQNGAATQITVTGTLNSVASTNFRIEFFASTTADGSGHGEGLRYLGSANVSTDGSGNASFNPTLTAATSAGEAISAVATRANAGYTVFTDSSEFAANVLAVPPTQTVSGTVYEDVNYGGGAGRSLAASSGAAVSGARVEVYDSAGVFVSATTTAGDGSYSFSLLSGTHYIRVASQTVVSTRSGSSGALRGVLTWRSNAASGSAVSVTDHVCGTNPLLSDPASAAGGTALNTGTLVYTAGLSGTAQAVSTVVVSAAAVSGLNFGFNFSTVCNTNNSSSGSLRQAITNANALDNTGLAQSGRSAGIEHLIFMLPNGTAAAGLRSSFNAFGAGVASVALASALPAVSAPLVLDAQTQPGWTAAPVLELNGTAAGAGAAGLSLGASSSVVRGFIINRFNGVGLDLTAGSGHTVQGNYIGSDAAGTAGSANGSDGVRVAAGVSASSIGGTTTGQGNLIRSNSGRGVAITTGASGVAVQGNSIFANGQVGIDLGIDGISANDGAKTGGQANQLMDSPVFTAATMSGTTLTVAGYVGSAAGQGVFASARVEVFASDSSFASGQGQTYLGFLTADASGNFSGTLTGVTAVGNGSGAITATATDGSGNTSEFGANRSVGFVISGTVFEDANYGGGDGRSLAASSGTGVSGATVELYDNAGVWVRATTSAAGGSYSFSGLAAATHHVRVVGASVLSQRSGSTGALLAVPTFRTTATSGTAVAVVDLVGGSNPAQTDPGAGSAGATFNPSTGVYSAVLTGTAQAFAPVLVGAAGVGNVDFGFNFNTVVHVNNGGAGSLRQVLTNTNTLGGDAALAVAGRTAALEHVVFMLADGTTRPGLRNTLPSQFAAGIASIVPTSALPTIGSTLVLDAQTQPGWVQDPIIELRGNAAGAAAGLTLNGGASTVRGLIVNRYNGDGINISGGAGHTVQGNWLGTDATGAAAAANTGAGLAVLSNAAGLQVGGTSAAQRNVVSGNSGQGVYVFGGSAIVVQGNHLGTNAAGAAAVANGGRGLWLDSAVTSATVGGSAAGAGNVVSGNIDVGVLISGGATTVQGNWLGTNAAGTAALANSHGLYLNSGGHLVGGTSAAARNVIAGNTGRGIWLEAGGNTVQGNHVGTNAAGTAALPNGDGIYAKGPNNVIGGTAAGAGNLVSGNSAAGVLLHALGDGTTVQGNTIGRNASLAAALPNHIGVSVGCSNGCTVGGTAAGAGNIISGNTTVGVSVSAASQSNAILGNAIYGNSGIGIDLNANGQSGNDGAKTGGAGNQLMDHPVFTSARARGNQLTVAGYVGTAAGQALFASARVEIFASDQDASGYGEGQTYLGSVTTDASGNFSATITMTQSVLLVGTQLTATATDAANNSSEFGANFSGLIVDLVVNHNGDAVDANPGDGICQTATPNQCTLRAALQEVNALAVQPGALTIAFALPGCSTGTEAACEITPPTNLPTATKAVVVDGSTQPSYATRPLVALVGPSSGTATALEFGAGSGASTARALRFAGWTAGTGTTLNLTGSNSHTVQGNWFGLDASGVATVGAANRYAVSTQGGSSSNIIGGTTTLQRNTVAGSSASGVYLLTGSANQVLGNWFGLNADGTSNAQSLNNIGLQLRSTGALVGGVLAGEGNRFGPATLHHIAVDTHAGAVPTSSATIRGNLLGFNGAGAAVASGSDGIFIDAGVSSTTIGGTTAAAGNSITGGSGRAIGIATGASTRATVQGNSIYGNTSIGIDLGRNGVTANDGLTNAAQANNGIDHPVITGAGVAGDGNSITVLGYIGTGVGQAAFAGARVELFKAAPDASGYGQGQVYLGYLTADGNGRYSGTVAVTFGSVVIGDAITATATDAAGNTSEFGPNWTSTNTAALAPVAFNAFETDTAAGALAGVIRSKMAGSAATLAVLALDYAGTAPHTAFTGTVQVNWLDARDDSGAITGSCRASWVDLGAAGSAVFSSNNRVDVAFTPPAGSTRAMRLKMTYTGPSGTVVACSNDAFAVLPAQIAWVAASDADSATAGTTRTLYNVAASGGHVHQAGRPFTLRAQALATGGALMTAYDGTPALTINSCVLPAACTPGTLGGGNVAAVAGLYTHNTVSYSEVGAVALQLSDTSYADVDSGDTALGTRTISSPGALQVGRFVPDSYAVAVSTAGVFATANAACLASGTGATFLGQGFGWSTAPRVTVTARNAAGATTVLWTGSLMKLAPGASLVPSVSVAAAGTATLATSFAASTVQDLGSGQARVQASALDRFVLDTPGGTPQDSTIPTWQWQLAITDSSEAGTAGNPQPVATAVQGSVLFDQGGLFHSGRLALAAAYGDARSSLRMLMQLQRYTSAGWVTMTEDRGCVTVQRAQLEVSSPSGVFVGAGACAAPLAADATTAGGRAWLAMPAAPGGVPGRLAVRVAGTAASGNACSPVGALQAVSSAGVPWLTGGTAGAGPQAMATWGSPQRDLVLRREIW